MSRPSWDETWLGILPAIAARATCDRGRSGCVIVYENRIVSTGYVGSPPGFLHCDDVGHELVEVTVNGVTSTHCVRTVHAEQNAIIQAARYGRSTEGATLYCTMTPCRTCAMLVISAGIARVVAAKDYHAGGPAKEMFKQAGVELTVVGDVVRYPNQGEAS